MSAGFQDATGRLQAAGIAIMQAPVQAQRALPVPAFQQILLPGGSPWCDQYRIDDGYLLRFPGLADFTVSSGGDRITCCAVPGTDEATLAHLLQNQAVPLALSRQGRLVLHASAVVVNGVALAFVGVSGRGKSTLAAAFAARGYRFLTDDGLQLEQVDDQVQVLPGPASLRLWDDARDALVTTAARTAAAVQHTPKLRLLADETLRHCEDACPVAAIYFLGDAEVENIRITPLGGQEVLLGLLQHCFLLDIEARELLVKTFACCGEVVRGIPAFTLDYPRRFPALPEIVARLQQHASGCTGNGFPPQRNGVSPIE